MEDDLTPFKRWFRSGLGRERRGASRSDTPGIVAHYWDGGAPAAHPVRNLSSGGLYLITERRWYPGTLLMLTLQEKSGFDDDSGRSITVQARVIRSGQDGVGLTFLAAEEGHSHPTFDLPLHGSRSGMAGRKDIVRFLRRIRETRN